MATKSAYDVAYRSVRTTRRYLINHMKFALEKFYSPEGLTEDEFNLEKERLGENRDEFLRHVKDALSAIDDFSLSLSAKTVRFANKSS